MSITKDPNDSNKTLYQGLSVEFINFIAQSYHLKYGAHNTYCNTIEIIYIYEV